MSMRPIPEGHSRNATADLLKGVAVLFMIQVHVMEQFGSVDAYNSGIGTISLFLGGPFCAPVFLAVMGYFLANRLHPFRYFLKRGVLLFLGGLALNAGRSAHLLTRILTGKADLIAGYYLFGADILTLAGLSLIIIGMLTLLFGEKIIPYLILAIGMAFATPYLPRLTENLPVSPYLTAFFWNTGEWSYFPVFPWLGYIVTGYAFRLALKRPAVQKMITVEYFRFFIIISWIVILVTIPWAARITRQLSGTGGYYHHGILFFGWVILFMAGYLAITNRFGEHHGGKQIPRMVCWFGQHVTLVYVIQWLIIGNLAPLLYQSQNVFQVILWFSGITAITVLLSLAWLKIRRYFSESLPWRPG